MREKSSVSERTFALTAYVAEALPIVERDLYLLGCQIQKGSSGKVNKVGPIG